MKTFDMLLKFILNPEVDKQLAKRNMVINHSRLHELEPFLDGYDLGREVSKKEIG